MRPLRYSEKDAKEHSVGWVRDLAETSPRPRPCASKSCPLGGLIPTPAPTLNRDQVRTGSKICYFQNQYPSQAAPKKKKPSAAAAAAGAAPREPVQSYYTLSMALAFPYDGDTVYVAQCYPYTYTMLQGYLGSLVERRSACMRRDQLCLSYGRHAVDLLTVTDFGADAAEIAQRKVVVISGRVHPGETNASWMMQGLIDAVTADTPAARSLRASVVLKIVPMLNPDGVVLGNYRCSNPNPNP